MRIQLYTNSRVNSDITYENMYENSLIFPATKMYNACTFTENKNKTDTNWRKLFIENDIK